VAQTNDLSGGANFQHGNTTAHSICCCIFTGPFIVQFALLKQHLGDRPFHSNEEMEMAVRERLLMPELVFYTEGLFFTREEMGQIHQCAGGGLC
jgi:hypothetical protein